MKKYGIEDIYKAYEDRKKMPYAEFKEIIREYNKIIVDSISSGETYKLPYNMGKIKLVITSRNFKKKRVDWVKSNQLKKEIIERGEKPREKGSTEGENWIVYYTDNFYCRIEWDKKKTKGNSVKNWKIYKFYPAWGFRRMTARKLKQDELNELVEV